MRLFAEASRVGKVGKIAIGCVVVLFLAGVAAIAALGGLAWWGKGKLEEVQKDQSRIQEAQKRADAIKFVAQSPQIARHKWLHIGVGARGHQPFVFADLGADLAGKRDIRFRHQLVQPLADQLFVLWIRVAVQEPDSHAGHASCAHRAHVCP